MSHITIIVGGKPPGGNLVAEEGSVTEASCTYAVPHDATAQKIGEEVAKIVKKINKMVGGPDIPDA